VSKSPSRHRLEAARALANWERGTTAQWHENSTSKTNNRTHNSVDVEEGCIGLGNVERHGKVGRAGTEVPGAFRGNGMHETIVQLRSRNVHGRGLDCRSSHVTEDGKRKVGLD
jgi:hypothetical protein